VLVIAGASGHLGRGAADELLRRVQPGNVRLLTRTPDRVAALAARGADVRFADLDDPASLPGAMAGGRRLLLISTDALDRRVTQHKAAIDAAVAAAEAIARPAADGRGPAQFRTKVAGVMVRRAIEQARGRAV
jgi:NAD(P)H dehydrogenase (quinone)